MRGPRPDVPAEEDLVRCIGSHTHWQVQDLDVDCKGSRVKVTGRSKTYYIKQLVTQAVLTSIPQVKLENNVLVCAG